MKKPPGPADVLQRSDTRTRKGLRLAWRVAKVGLGFVLLIAGLLLAVPGVPGPGILLLFLGLVLLSSEFIWARRLRRKLHDQAKRVVPKKWMARFAR